jgi:hypothetical protein
MSLVVTGKPQLVHAVIKTYDAIRRHGVSNHAHYALWFNGEARILICFSDVCEKLFTLTKDGRHFCSVFMRNDFQSCEKFGISYEGEKVVAGEKPYFAAGYPNIAEIIIGKEKFCVE